MRAANPTSSGSGEVRWGSPSCSLAGFQRLRRRQASCSSCCRRCSLRCRWSCSVGNQTPSHGSTIERGVHRARRSISCLAIATSSMSCWTAISRKSSASFSRTSVPSSSAISRDSSISLITLAPFQRRGPAWPAMLSGVAYRNELPFREFQQKSIEERSLFTVLARNGFRVHSITFHHREHPPPAFPGGEVVRVLRADALRQLRGVRRIRGGTASRSRPVPTCAARVQDACVQPRHVAAAKPLHRARPSAPLALEQPCGVL